MTVVAAVDLGASSGRVMTGRVTEDSVELTEVHRFRNGPVRLGSTLHWDILGLYQGILDGLRAAGPIEGVGIDTWAVDYGLLDSTGALLGNPVHYRDSRTDGVAESLPVPPESLYAATGVQVLPFNTIYQLMAEPRLALADELLMIPDLLAHWLTGSRGTEITNASTTGLLDIRGRRWDVELMCRLGIDPSLFGDLREPGDRIGVLQPHIGLGEVPVIAVGSHDTASAVVGVPARSERFAYVSCGTWSLVGVELDAPVLTEASRAANFSNELGVDGTVRYLRNVMGLWLLQESLRAWGDPELPPLLAEAAGLPPRARLVDANDPAFLPPGDMPARIAQACHRTGQTPPSTPAETVRCILDSLALAHRKAVRQAMSLSGRDVDVVHMVGGGARNAVLCQLTADACGLPVVAGPVEATALGNVLIQARALGAVDGGLADLRALLAKDPRLVRYTPSGTAAEWDEAERRLP
ncbi:rhamnulokinase [Allokutzneria oryzae]|uniref:Rhamnulokinase family protein n=1 Tax=Allokutzneria oryzae TaxID=1378989 RepID=A0ABV5ZXP4_9PSEU